MRQFALKGDRRLKSFTIFTLDQVELSLSKKTTLPGNWCELVPISVEETVVTETVTVEKKKCVVL